LRLRFAVLLLAPALVAAFAQDERRVASPDGRVEFRVFLAPQAPDYLYRLAYDVNVQGKPLIVRSYLALDLLNQEPLLGENDGLIGSRTGSGTGYNSLVAEYMQNGSIGRLIDVEARVYNDGVAFRYVLPRSTPLIDLLIADEATEFRFPQGTDTPRGVGESGLQGLPFVAAIPDGGSVAILEVRTSDFAAMSLARLDENTVVTRLKKLPNDPEVAFQGHTPFAGPWRVILFGTNSAKMLDLAWLKSLKP
jgi:alpha-glucosidase